LKSPQESNTNSSKNGKSSFTSTELKRLKQENGQIEESLRSCQIKIDKLIPVQRGPGTPDAADLEEELTDLEAVLRGHFECEEQGVIEAFRKWGKPELVLPLEEQIEEKEQTLEELAGLRKEVGCLIAHSLGLEPGYDTSIIGRKMESLAHRIKLHQQKEESIFNEAQRAAEGESLTP
jgi:hypothetical protein